MIRYFLKKRNGDRREIYAVKGRLKIVQGHIYNWLCKTYKTSDYATGFVKGSSIIK